MNDSNSSLNVPTGLYWKGKNTEVDRVALPFQTIEIINESRATREKEKDTMFPTKIDTSWYNRLIWGDNKYIMASLLEEFAGKIDLIYIDPPFATGADFSVKIEIGDVGWTKEPSIIEEKAYRDTWGQGLDSYLQMMYERLVLMRELLSDKGSIYVHLDWHIGHYVKLLLDEIFGKGCFRNEIIWRYRRWPSVSEDFQKMHDNIYRYSRNDQVIWNQLYEELSESSIRQWKGKSRVDKRSDIGTRYSITKEQDSPGVQMSDVWEISQITAPFNEYTGFSTQKPEALLDRIISSSSKPGDLIADFFCGSGTTGAVAEKLGRRWIMADIGRYAIHTTRKRLLEIDSCKPFLVQNLSKYERQYWQGITFQKRSNEQVPLYEYIQFILELYYAEPITGLLHLHGKKGKRLVHVGAVDVPVTLDEILESLEEVKKIQQNGLDILGWEWEMGLHEVVEEESKMSNIDLKLLNIPRDVMDKRAVEKGEIVFFELAYLEVEAKKDKYDEFFIELKDFAIPNLDIIPKEVKEKIAHWSDFIDYWAIDWDWNKDIFHNQWQSYRTRKDRSLPLKSDSHKYSSHNTHTIMIKVIDIFGNDTTQVLEVES